MSAKKAEVASSPDLITEAGGNTFLECPICERNFDDVTILEIHVKECMDLNAGQSCVHCRQWIKESNKETHQCKEMINLSSAAGRCQLQQAKVESVFSLLESKRESHQEHAQFLVWDNFDLNATYLTAIEREHFRDVERSMADPEFREMRIRQMERKDK